MSFIDKYKTILKENLKKRLGREVLRPLDISDYIENKIGFVPIGLDYFCPSRKILKQLLQNKIQEDNEADSILTDQTIRHHIGEELLPDSFDQQIFLYIFSKRVALLKRWFGNKLKKFSILEVGDSDGLILGNLGKKGVGVNISRGAVKNVMRHGIKAVQCDIHSMPFKPKSFDVVMMFQTFEHLPNPIETLNILASLSRDRIIVSIPEVPKTNIFSAGLMANLPQYRQHVFEFSDNDFKKIVTHSPFIINRKETINVFGKPKTFAQLRLYLYCNHQYLWGGIVRRQTYYELIFKNDKLKI